MANPLQNVSNIIGMGQQAYQREAFDVPQKELALQKGQYEMRRLNALEEARQKMVAGQQGGMEEFASLGGAMAPMQQAQEVLAQQNLEEQKYMAQAARRVLAAKTPWDKKRIWKAERARAESMGYDVSDDPIEYNEGLEGQLQALIASVPVQDYGIVSKTGEADYARAIATLRDPYASDQAKFNAQSVRMAFEAEKEITDPVTGKVTGRARRVVPGMVQPEYPVKQPITQQPLVTDIQKPAEIPQEIWESPKMQAYIAEQATKQQYEAIAKQEEFETEKKRVKPKVDSSFRSLQNDVANIEGTIDKVIVNAGTTTAGLLGSYITGVWQPAKDLEENLKTIQADAAFGRLQEMRDNSPTGGALGQVSERELALLQNAKVALSQSQNPEQLIENLERYKQIRRDALQNTAEAYRADYEVYPKGFDIGEQDIPSTDPRVQQALDAGYSMEEIQQFTGKK